jgi:hypothetical protein
MQILASQPVTAKFVPATAMSLISLAASRQLRRPIRAYERKAGRNPSSPVRANVPPVEKPIPMRRARQAPHGNLKQRIQI